MGVFLALVDVGHGNCAVLVDTGGVVVVDAGPGSSLLEFLEREKIARLETVLVSHADKDHIAGLLALISAETVSIGRDRLNSDAEKKSELWQDLLYVLDKCHKEGKIDFNVALTIRDSHSFNVGVVDVEILAPSLRLAGIGPGGNDSQGRVLSTNSMSAVIRLSVGGRKVALLTGDLDEAGLANMLEDVDDISSDVLVFPHHGGRPGAGDEKLFAEEMAHAVKPQTVVFSIGRGRFGTPRKDIVASLRSSLPSIRVLCTQLSEHCASALPATEPMHLVEKYARGRRERACCAGTVVIEFASSPSVLPIAKDHAAFIAGAAPMALCTH